jgi:hypothetical protein
MPYYCPVQICAKFKRNVNAQFAISWSRGAVKKTWRIVACASETPV